MLRTMKSIVLLFCVAGLIVPGRNIWSADTNHNFAKWDKDISAFEQSDITNPPAKGGFLFTGSRTIANWKSLAQDFPGQPVINRGFGGSEIVDATHFADGLFSPTLRGKFFSARAETSCGPANPPTRYLPISRILWQRFMASCRLRKLFSFH